MVDIFLWVLFGLWLGCLIGCIWLSIIEVKEEKNRRKQEGEDDDEEK